MYQTKLPSIITKKIPYGIPRILITVVFSDDLLVFSFFFFQAEDGIRDWSVTGVQTCALPISGGRERLRHVSRRGDPAPTSHRASCRPAPWSACRRVEGRARPRARAACRTSGSGDRKSVV